MANLDLQSLTSSARLSQIARDVLTLAKAAGADAAEVDIALSQGLAVSAHNAKLQSLEHSDEQAISVTVYKGGATGSVDSTDFSSPLLRQLVGKAMDLASFTESDPCNGLVASEELAFNYPDLDLCHPWTKGPDWAIQAVVGLQEVACQTDSRVKHVESADIGVEHNLVLYANSQDFIGYYPYTRYALSCQVVAEQDGAKQGNSDYDIGCDASVFKAPERVAAHAAQKACALLGARKIKTQSCPVVFQAECARGLIGSLLQAISGSAQYRRSTYLLDQLDQQVVSSLLTVKQEPHQRRILSSAPFDGDGARTRDYDIIKEGMLQSYILSGYSARKLGLNTTGNAGGLYNVHVATGSLSFEKLLSEMGRGLLVTDLMGQGVNILTGDYSRGASGFWVENGAVQYPVHEITIAGNLRQMLQSIVAIANDIDYRGNIKTGSIWLENMTVAGS